jgi:Brinker DNA-binding domain
MSSQSESDLQPTPPKKKNYELSFKLRAVEYAEKHDKSKAAKEFKVDRRQVQKWSQQKAELQAQL